jgi:hypothetical protein
MKKYIKNSRKRKQRMMGDVLVIEKDPLPSTVDIEEVLEKVKDSVPSKFFRRLDSIYIGKFKNLEDRKLNAMYSDGAIYVTNDQDSVDDTSEDIVHEMAHAIEDEISSEIYSDGSIESEFKGKRERLYFMLKEEGYDVELANFLDLKYSTSFDSFLYSEVGYPMLSALTVNLFYSPYGATSLNEYFANCFEAYFFRKDVYRVKRISPNVFAILEKISYNEE